MPATMSPCCGSFLPGKSSVSFAGFMTMHKCPTIVPSGGFSSYSRRTSTTFCMRAACFSSSSSGEFRRYAVLGAGFAGVSVVWHLLQLATASLHVSVDLYDEEGIGAGASGVSGGLLHPYSPKGRLVWNGREGWTAALELLAVAEAANQSIMETDCIQSDDFEAEPVSWRRGILRPAASQKHSDDFVKHVKLASEEHQKIAGLSCINGRMASTLVPGLAVSPDDLALYIADGLNIDPLRYLKALWRACELHANYSSTKGSSGSSVVLKRTHISCLSSLSDDYDAVIACLGAGVCQLPELSGKLPITLCRGVVTQLGLPPGREEEFKFEGPSIVGETWLAAQGPHKLILGATKEWGNANTSAAVTAKRAASASSELLAKAAAFYPPITNWLLKEAHAGVRAMTPRTELGKIPLVGCIDDIVGGIYPENMKRNNSLFYWIFGGLGSRGLIYHAWLGRKVAEAVVSQNETCLPKEFLQWKSKITGNHC